MRAEIHSLCWPTADPLLAEKQAQVFRHFELPIRQHGIKVSHGLWIDALLTQSEADVVMLVDNDCVPLKREAVLEAIQYAWARKIFLGLAQSSGHIDGGRHVFAAPAFLAVSRQAWEALGRPSFQPNPRSDVAQELSRQAEEKGLVYRAWYPTHFHRPSREGLWRLGNYGCYGIGSVFADRVFHLYQGRFGDNVALFAQVCDRICEGSFSVEGLLPCQAV